MPPACRVLVVDDDELIRVYLTSVLKSAGFEVDVADSGRSALRRLHAGSYDILLTDYEMPEMDGPTLCQRVRVEFPAGSLYVLMFTVKDAREDRHEGFKSGADEYIIKGSSKSEVLEKMNAGRRIQMTQHEISRCYTESRFLPRIDPLTHARTLKYFAQQMPKEIQRARRSQQPLSVASCRIEGFEQLTRQYGYAVADETIRAVAADARHCLRARQDWFARVGEDRFMLVFPRTRFNGAERLARKLRRLASLPVMTRAGPIRCTVKIVVTACEPRDEPARWA
jgi:diguanylate cyclase (GGDEF)-like protein